MAKRKRRKLLEALTSSPEKEERLANQLKKIGIAIIRTQEGRVKLDYSHCTLPGGNP